MEGRKVHLFFPLLKRGKRATFLILDRTSHQSFLCMAIEKKKKRGGLNRKEENERKKENESLNRPNTWHKKRD